jgi:hypothetical protein
MSEMSTRGELCLMKEQLEAQDQKLQALQNQLQAEKQVPSASVAAREF